MIVSLILSFVLGFFLAITVLYIGKKIMISSMLLHGPVFVPSKDIALQSMLSMANLCQDDVIIDLGSGDGKVVLACAEKGFSATGVEINPWLVWQARNQAKKMGLEHQAKFVRANFWSLNYSAYNVIFLYGTFSIMEKLEKKLLLELKPGSKVISNHFKFATWRPLLEENDVRIYKKY